MSEDTRTIRTAIVQVSIELAQKELIEAKMQTEKEFEKIVLQRGLDVLALAHDLAFERQGATYPYRASYYLIIGVQSMLTGRVSGHGVFSGIDTLATMKDLFQVER